MARYTLSRLIGLVPTLFVILGFSFVLVRLSPGSPFSQERALDPEVRAALDARYGLDKPLPQQFGRYLWALGHGDMGPSIRYPGRQVTELIALGLPHTLLLGLCATLFGLAAGLTVGLLGAWAALTERPWLCMATLALTTLGQSLPAFVLGPLWVLGLCMGAHLLPPAGWGEARHLILPVLTLGTALAAHVARLTYGGLKDVMNAPYVRTARAKGLSDWAVLSRHMLIGGLTPLLTYLGPAISGILVGSVAIERIFCVPGIGPYFVDAALNRDYFLVMGIVLLESVLLLLCNLAVDLGCAWLDPRIRLGGLQ